MAKGRRRGRRKGRKGGKARKSKKAKARRKSSKRSRAAKKAARTRREKKEARRAAARKAARARKRRGGGKRRKARKAGGRRHRKSGGRRKRRSGSKRRRSGSRKRKGGSRPTPAQVGRAAYRATQQYDRQMTRLKNELARAQKREAEHRAAGRKAKDREIVKLQKVQQRLHNRIERLRAAEEARKSSRRHGRRRRRNPVTGGGEHVGAVLGVIVGGFSTVFSDRLAASHPLAVVSGGQGGAGGFTDSPAQGDVPDLSAAALPLWANFKHAGWKRLLAAAANIGVPLFVAHFVKHEGGKTFLQLWGFTALGITGAKVTTDLAAKAIGSKAIGMRLYAPEMAAKSVAAVSAQAQLPTISVAPGLGLVGLTGYGRAAVGAGNCGCGGKCGKCGANTLGQFPPGACNGQPQPGSPQPTPPQPLPSSNGGQPGTGVSGAPRTPVADTRIDNAVGAGGKNITSPLPTPSNVRAIGDGRRGSRRNGAAAPKRRTWM
jgi:hypothetical protein